MKRREFTKSGLVLGMGQGQGAGTAAALCALKNNGTRELNYGDLRDTLVKDGVYFER
jgi:hypothetical protein